MLLLSERRKLQRERSKKLQRERLKKVEAFEDLPAIPSHSAFLAARSEFLYCARRLGILQQSPKKHSVEIEWLEGVRNSILKAYPHVENDLREEDYAPSRLEL
jgi:hypothetical protein